MSVTMMVGKERAGQANVVETTWPGVKEPLYLETTHRGLVLELGEHNHYDDSDFYAIVWDPVKGMPQEVEYATTRGWSYPNHAKADATPEVRAAYQAWLDKRAAEAKAEAAIVEAKTPGMGKRVKVVRGRKVPIGTVGIIFWMKEATYSPRFRNGYRRGPDTVKIGIALSEQKDTRGRYMDVAWTYLANVEVVSIGKAM